MRVVHLRTPARCVLVDVTDEVAAAVAGLGLVDGAAFLHVPHTTASVIVNEGYDPDVQRDLIARLAALAPHGRGTDGTSDRHAEGNSDAHLKTALLGSATLVPVVDGALRLGRWQRIFFCEWDGPRSRELWVASAT